MGILSRQAIKNEDVKASAFIHFFFSMKMFLLYKASLVVRAKSFQGISTKFSRISILFLSQKSFTSFGGFSMIKMCLGGKTFDYYEHIYFF